MPLHVWTSARYAIALPDGHRFPMPKYARLRDRVLAAGLVAPEHVHDPGRASRDELLLVHAAAYVDAVTDGTLPDDMQRRIGLPWSPAFVERAYRVVRGTVEAARHALDHGLAMNLAGGTHHAFADRGEGFCTFNDVAVAIRALQRAGRVRRAAVVDLDVHQGNGTHAIFAGDDSVYTFSMHGAKNFPFRASRPDLKVEDSNPGLQNWGLRVPGDLDIDLDDGTSDEDYLSILYDALPRVLRESSPDLVIYLAGADPHEGDRLGRMKLTFDGLARRDDFVLSTCREVGIPVAVTIAGGYGRDVDDTVTAHVNTVRIAASYSP